MTSITTFTLALLAQAATASPSPSAAQPSSGMTTTLDIAALISALLWPTVLLVVLLLYRRQIPVFVEGIAARITKFEFGGFSLELAKATPFVPDWSAGKLDLRHTATAVLVNDSTARTFSAQLMQGGSADYAELNLGAGEEWLTSRLLIMSIIFARTKGIQSLVFLETSGNTRRRFAGWAEPEKVRWALAQRYPWLEQAYADAYSEVISGPAAFVVNNRGALGQEIQPNDPGPTIDLIQKFLQRVQAVFPVPPPPDEWVIVEETSNTYEHASWIDSEDVEMMLGNDFHTSTIHASELGSKNTKDQLRVFLSQPVRFQAVVGDDGRFQYLVDRRILLEQVSARIVSEG